MKALVVLAAVTAVADARPGEPIVVVSSDAAFGAALGDALVPAGMAVIAVGDVTPPSIGELSAESRRLADREHATATVWLLPASAGATLVTYDRQVDRVLVRELPYPSPLTATQAAEAARMVRTMLRALRAEGDQAPPPPPPPPKLVPPPPPVPWLAASVGVGAWFAAPAETTSIAGSATLVWRPRGFGVALTGAFAPVADVMTSTFTGHARDVVLAAEARRAFEVLPNVFVSPAAGLAFHLFRLSGAPAEGEAVDSHRYDPAIRVGATGLYALPAGIDVGLAVSSDFLLQRQRYVVGTDEILVIPRVQVMTHLVVGIRL